MGTTGIAQRKFLYWVTYHYLEICFESSKDDREKYL